MSGINEELEPEYWAVKGMVDTVNISLMNDYMLKDIFWTWLRSKLDLRYHHMHLVYEMILLVLSRNRVQVA